MRGYIEIGPSKKAIKSSERAAIISFAREQISLQKKDLILNAK